MVRLLRVARSFRMTKGLDTYRAWVELLIEVVHDSLLGLRILAFVFLLAIVLFSSLLFFTEQGTWRPDGEVAGVDDDGGHGGIFTRPSLFGDGYRERSAHSSIPRLMWLVMVTGPTVGYGDLFPTTKMGKFIGGVLVLSTMLVVAFPVTIIAKNMNEKYTELLTRVPPPEPYALASMVRRQSDVESLGRAVTDRVTSMRDKRIMTADDACWVATQVLEVAHKYAEQAAQPDHWDGCMMTVLALLARLPEGPDKELLRREILEFAEASLR